MKIIYDNGTVAMGIGEGEYRIGKAGKTEKGGDAILQAKYLYEPASAVKALAKAVANEEAESLWEWLDVYAEVSSNVAEAVSL